MNCNFCGWLWDCTSGRGFSWEHFIGKPAVLVRCPVCNPAHFPPAEKEEPAIEAELLPDNIPLPLLRLRELQLAACTKVMREVAGALQDMLNPDTHLEDVKAISALASKLNRVRAGLPAEEE